MAKPGKKKAVVAETSADAKFSKYKVLSRIKYGPDYYRRNETIELTADDAQDLIAAKLIEAR